MGQRRRFGTMFFLLAGLLAVAGQVPGQPAPPPPGDVIASSSPPAAPPDDGLAPLVPVNKLAAPPQRSTPPPPPASAPLRQAVFTPERAPATVPAPATAGTAGGGLSLEIVGPAQVAIGQPLSCTIVVRNHAPTVLAGVRVELPLPPGARTLSTEPAAEARNEQITWQVGNLEGGGQRRLQATILTGDAGEAYLCPRAQFSTAQGLRTQVVRPAFGLSITGPENAAVGGHVILQIVLTNNRNVPLPRVTLRDQLPAGLTHPQGKEIEAELGPLAPGEVKTVRLDTIASAPGRQINEVIAWADYADGRIESRAQAITQIVQSSLSLRLDGPRAGAINEEIDFRLTLDVPADASAGDVHLAQYVPEGLELVSASTGGSYNPSNRVITWRLGTLSPKQRENVAFKLRGKLSGDWALPAAASATGMAEGRTTHAIHLDVVPALTLELPPHEGPLDVGSETVYQLRVANTGGVAASNVVLVVWLPEGLQAVSGEGPSDARVQAQQVVFAPLSQLAPNGDAIYRVRARATAAGTGRFRAQLQANALPRPLVHELVTQVRGLPAGARPAPGPGGPP